MITDDIRAAYDAMKTAESAVDDAAARWSATGAHDDYTAMDDADGAYDAAVGNFFGRCEAAGLDGEQVEKTIIQS